MIAGYFLTYHVQPWGASTKVASDISNGSNMEREGTYLMLDLSRHAYIIMQTYFTTSYLVSYLYF